MSNGHVTIVLVDHQRRSVFLSDGRRIPFAKARRMGIDVEDARTGQAVSA